MFDLSACPLRRATINTQEGPDDERTMLFDAVLEDEDLLELSDDQQGSASWSALESIILTEDTDTTEEDNTSCIDLWDEDAVVYDWSSEGFWDATFSSSQSTLSDEVNLDGEACWSSPRPITSLSQAGSGRSQQSSEADDEATVRLSHAGFSMLPMSTSFQITHKTGLSVWPLPDPTHPHTSCIADAQKPPHAPRDLILESDDDDFAEDIMVALNMRSHDQGPSAGRICCMNSELANLNEDDGLNENNPGYHQLSDEYTLTPRLGSCYGLEPTHLSSRDIIASELGNGDLCGGPGILSYGE